MSKHCDQNDDITAGHDDAHQAAMAGDAGDVQADGISLEAFWARLDPIDA